MRIAFDETNLLAEMVGEKDGLTRTEIRDGSALAHSALRGFEKLHHEGKYGFPELPSDSKTIDAVVKYARKVRGSFDTVCLVGIGGSALGAWALDCALRGPHPIQGEFNKKHPRLVILDNVDPEFTGAALASMDPRKTLTVAVAKSGSTAESMAMLLVVREWMRKKLGRGTAKRIAAVTSAGRGDLEALAEREGWQVFHLPENVGGRFSVLSAVGLLPAALIGVDITRLARGAAVMTRACWKNDLAENTALKAALYHFLIWTRRSKTIHVAFPYSNRLWGLAFWFRQLWAESLGKAKDRRGYSVAVGQTPVAALGTTDQHSQVQLYMDGPNDKVFTFWRAANHSVQGKIPAAKLGLDAFDYLGGQTLSKLLDTELRSTEAALTASHRPSCCFTLDAVDAEHVGAFLQLLEFETAFMGELLDINAFDQEGVELGKKFTYALMGRKGFEPFREQFTGYENKRKSVRGQS